MDLPGPSLHSCSHGGCGGAQRSHPQQSRFALTFNASGSPRGGTRVWKTQHLCGFNLSRRPFGGGLGERRWPCESPAGGGGLKIEPRISKEAVGRRAKPGQSRMVSETKRREEGTGVKRERSQTASHGKAQVGWTRTRTRTDSNLLQRARLQAAPPCRQLHMAQLVHHQRGADRRRHSGTFVPAATATAPASQDGGSKQ